MKNFLRISLKLIFVFFLVTAGIHLMAFIRYSGPRGVLANVIGVELADKFLFLLGIIFVFCGVSVAFLEFRKELKILLLALIVAGLSSVFSVYHLYVSDFTGERRVKDAKEKAEKQIQELSAQVLPDTNWVENKIKIYFYNKNDGLFSINIDGSDLKKIFPSDKEIKEYAFSPNGNLLLVGSSWYEKNWVRHDELYVLNISNNQQQRVDSSQSIDHIKWSPDNASILYTKSLVSKL